MKSHNWVMYLLGVLQAIVILALGFFGNYLTGKFESIDTHIMGVEERLRKVEIHEATLEERDQSIVDDLDEIKDLLKDIRRRGQYKGKKSVIYKAITKEIVKQWLGSTASDNDTFLDRLCNQVTNIIEGYIEKPLITRLFSERYNGNADDTLILKNRPIYKIDTIHDDLNYVFDSGTLIAASNYFFDASSGIVYAYNDVSSFKKGVQNIKAVYYAGYSKFTIVANVNDRIDLSDGSVLVVSLTAGNYDAFDMADHMQTQFNAVSSGYTISYDYERMRFKFLKSSGEFSLLFSTGANSTRSSGELFGLGQNTDANSASSIIESTDPVSGLPSAFETACQMLVTQLFHKSTAGKGRQGIVSEEINKGGTRSFSQRKLPPEVELVLEDYRPRVGV